LLLKDESVQAEVLQELTNHSNVKNAGSFFCSILGCMIVEPCGASSCNYHVVSKEAEFNCIAKYKFDTGNSNLSTDVISSITDIPESRIKASLERSFNKIRSYTILSDINTGKHNRFDYFKGAHVCVVCGALTPKKAFTVEKDSGLFYCSRSCYKKKPPSLIKLEMFYRADIRVVLAAAKKTLRKLPMISSTLDVKRRILVRWFEDFLGMHPSVFGADAVEFADIMRRTVPKHSWSLEFLNSLHSKPGPLVNQRMLELESTCKKLCLSL